MYLIYVFTIIYLIKTFYFKVKNKFLHGMKMIYR